MIEQEVMLAADGLRVVFFRSGDRWAHRVEVFDESRNTWIANYESVEGEPDDPWPPSPPFQQLHVEDRATGRVILLIGMAGRTHWSASVEVAADRRSIQFDVAARIQSPPEKVGSAYGGFTNEGGSSIRRLTIQTSPGTQMVGSVVKPLAIGSPPSTIAWHYAITLAHRQ